MREENEEKSWNFRNHPIEKIDLSELQPYVMPASTPWSRRIFLNLTDGGAAISLLERKPFSKPKALPHSEEGSGFRSCTIQIR